MKVEIPHSTSSYTSTNPSSLASKSLCKYSKFSSLTLLEDLIKAILDRAKISRERVRTATSAIYSTTAAKQGT
jgi:hypothetical protein